MSIFICNKCGCIENTAPSGYWSQIANNEAPVCSECRYGKWHDYFSKQHWTEYGVEKLLKLEAQNDGSMINATEYLKSIGEIE